ncbi:hypothetical protein PC118_g8718 [Phytophthora cactorum]|uniref:Uncharacterized protein n=1 Tax=Phytophthora cactorum TaxID=29920 RepID=A0A8T1G340_9STRA|nr:hypothetical protein PC118_g8718 [Phytophthora cactorum]KAG3060491.1 hypothetical protein PC121_g13444 [Phytophthora cactorum]
MMEHVVSSPTLTWMTPRSIWEQSSVSNRSVQYHSLPTVPRPLSVEYLHSVLPRECVYESRNPEAGRTKDTHGVEPLELGGVVRPSA